MDDHNVVPHGTEIFSTHGQCVCDLCRPLRQAVRDLVDSFHQIPRRWIETLSEGEIALPMWGTLFAVGEPCDIRNIDQLLVSLDVHSDEDVALAASGWEEVRGTGIYALEFDGEFLLGIDGAGYDFYATHWSRLYDALGYQWHTSEGY